MKGKLGAGRFSPDAGCQCGIPPAVDRMRLIADHTHIPQFGIQHGHCPLKTEVLVCPDRIIDVLGLAFAGAEPFNAGLSRRPAPVEARLLLALAIASLTRLRSIPAFGRLPRSDQ